MNKQSLAFVDHSYHKRTKSTYFLRDILEKEFFITDLWDETWEGGGMPSIESINKFDYVVFFQVLPEIKELRKIKAKIVWVPMYDAVIWRPETTWELLKTINLKIISFSNTITKKLTDKGFDIIGENVYLNTANFPECKFENILNVFYWQRTNIDFKKMLSCLPKNKLGKLIIKIDPDPGFKSYTPSIKDLGQCKLEIIRGDMEKEMYLEKLRSCNVYIAPRKTEGIGWSFLEAMSMGMAVIATNAPTMNEYIINGENGILVDKNQGNRIYDYKEIVEIAANARKSCSVGYQKWTNDSKKINDFIKSNSNKQTVGHKIEDNLLFKIKHFLLTTIADKKFRKFTQQQ